MENNYIGMVCSADLSEAYGVEHSGFCNKMIENEGINGKSIIYIPRFMLNQLVHESFEGNCFKWNIKKIKEYAVEKE